MKYNRFAFKNYYSLNILVLRFLFQNDFWNLVLRVVCLIWNFNYKKKDVNYYNNIMYCYDALYRFAALFVLDYTILSENECHADKLLYLHKLRNSHRISYDR